MNTLANEFTRDIPRGVTTRFLNQQKQPQACWLPIDSILRSSAMAYDPRNPGGALMVGCLGDRLLGINDNRHALMVGGSRAGKSVSLVNNLLFYRGSVLALDPKGELAKLTAQRRTDLGQRVCILDPFGIVSEQLAPYRSRFNPLALLDPASDTIIEDAGLISDALVIAGGKDPHWDESAQNFIEGLLLHIATEPKLAESRTLVTLRKLINTAMLRAAGEDEAFELELAMLRNAARLCRNPETEDIGDTIEGAARDFFEKPANERGNVLSNARRHTKLLDYPALKGVLTGHDFSLPELKTVPPAA